MSHFLPVYYPNGSSFSPQVAEFCSLGEQDFSVELNKLLIWAVNLLPDKSFKAQLHWWAKSHNNISYVTENLHKLVQTCPQAQYPTIFPTNPALIAFIWQNTPDQVISSRYVRDFWKTNRTPGFKAPDFNIVSLNSAIRDVRTKHRWQESKSKERWQIWQTVKHWLTEQVDCTLKAAEKVKQYSAVLHQRLLEKLTTAGETMTGMWDLLLCVMCI